MRLGFKFGQMADHIGLDSVSRFRERDWREGGFEVLMDRLEREDPVMHFKLMLVLEKMDRTHAGEDYDKLNSEYNRLLCQFEHGWIGYRLYPRDPVCASEPVWDHPDQGSKDGYWASVQEAWSQP